MSASLRWRSLLGACPLALTLLMGPLAAWGQAPDGAVSTRLLPWSTQLAVREQWLAKRHELLLPMLRRHGISMWIVVNEEFHDDTGYPEENLGPFFEPMAEGRNPGRMLAQLVDRYQPRTIALALDGSRGVTRGLTHATFEALREWFGPEVSRRFVSAADLIEEYFDTRIPEEHEHYTTLVRLTDEITRRTLSSEVITPGKTTVGDVRRWLFDELGRRG